MYSSSFTTKLRQQFAVGTSIFALVANLQAAPPDVAPVKPAAVSPIQHVIVIIGENRTFDHVFATYQPKSGQTVSNLLARGIVTADGKPGPKAAEAAQSSALDAGSFVISPAVKKQYTNIPPPGTDGAPSVASDTSPAPFVTMAVAKTAEPDLPAAYDNFLLTGATGLPNHVVDTREANVNTLDQGPSRSRRRSAMTIMPAARFTAFTRCGSRQTALPSTRFSRTPVAASMTCSPGLK